MAGRKKHAWGKRYGLVPNTLQRLAEGGNVGTEVLSTVCRVENASISWLLDGKGAPFLVHHASSDEESSDLLGRLIEDEPGWTVYQLQDPSGRLAFALTQPAQFERKGEWISYTELEVCVGEVGPASRAALSAAATSPERNLLTLDEKSWGLLQSGNLGTWQLVGDREHPGLLAKSKLTAFVEDSHAAYVPALSQEARTVGRWFDTLTDSQRKAFGTLFGIEP